MSTADRLAAATQLQDQALALVRREHPSTIAAYVPVGPEPGGADLPRVLAAHARVLLPVLLPDGDLDWAVFDGTLAPGPRGLLEPAGPRLGVDAIRGADLVLVPALAVDRRGMRMGRGGGSYDRVLDRLAGQAPVVALLHDGELVDEVPAEPHDRPVDAVLTPRGAVTLNSAALGPAALGPAALGPAALGPATPDPAAPDPAAPDPGCPRLERPQLGRPPLGRSPPARPQLGR